MMKMKQIHDLLNTNFWRLICELYSHFLRSLGCFLVACVAQWLERRAQRSDDPCVRGSNPTVGRGCRCLSDETV
jgi:hypothetical protein